jgi:hypothetical protein
MSTLCNTGISTPHVQLILMCVAGSIGDEAVDFSFSLPIPSSPAMTPELTYSLTEMSTRNLPGE